jgi:predicted RNase H-like HicB family nuclease
MNDDINELHNRGYITIIRLGETTGGSYCYVAFHPELPGCMSQGETPEEAEENLREATEMVIRHLVSNHLHVPDPASLTPSFPSRLSYGRTAKAKLQPVLQP